MQCDVYLCYRDPTWDFAILRFDLKKIGDMTLVPLNLRPDLAKIGVDICVMRNDLHTKRTKL